jgi:hypothetical protein
MLPFTLSDIPWWGWLLSAAVIYLIARYFTARLGKSTFGADAGEQKDIFEVGYRTVAFILSLVAALCAVIGIVKLVKWGW